MMRKTWKSIAAWLGCLTLAASVTGCTTAPVPTEPSAEKTQPASTSEPSISLATEAVSYDPSAWPQLKPYSQEPLLEADPEREVYFSLNNQDCDFYPDAVYNGAAFDIITKGSFRPEEIQVSFPGKTKCEVRVTERSEEFQHIAWNQETSSYNLDGQQPYHYLCMHCTDLQTLGQQSSDARCAAEVYASLVQNNQAGEQDYKALMETYVEPYSTRFQEYLDGYMQQASQKVTEANAYTVNLLFDQQSYVDETVEAIDVSVGGQSYHVELGQWRFHASAPESSGKSGKGVALETVAILGASGDSPYAEGYMKVDEAIRFRAEEDILLTGMRFADGTPAELLGARVTNTSATSMEYFWNGRDPIRMDSGSNVSMTLYLYSARFREYEMSMTGTVYVDYVRASTGAEDTMAVPCKISRYNRMWDTYCLAFLGVDVGEYYHDFSGEVMELNWMEEIPEGWRKS